MAKEVVMRCDAAFTVKVRDCGEVHDDTQTFTIRVDGKTWEIDLGGPHAAALLDICARGRELDPGIRRPSGHGNLERRVRNLPQ